MDVDTGIDDDAIAIIMALQSPEIEIIGITTVSGNVTAKAAALNTLGILRKMGRVRDTSDEGSIKAAI
jgi:purine nucleosidase